jgi:hypothetical protein
MVPAILAWWAAGYHVPVFVQPGVGWLCSVRLLALAWAFASTILDTLPCMLGAWDHLRECDVSHFSILLAAIHHITAIKVLLRLSGCSATAVLLQCHCSHSSVVTSRPQLAGWRETGVEILLVLAHATCVSFFHRRCWGLLLLVAGVILPCPLANCAMNICIFALHSAS